MHFIYFNTRGTQGGSTQIKNMLTYIQDSRHENVVDKTTEIVDSLVSRVKNAEEVSGAITIENAAHSLEIGNEDFLKLMN